MNTRKNRTKRSFFELVMPDLETAGTDPITLEMLTRVVGSDPRTKGLAAAFNRFVLAPVAALRDTAESAAQSLHRIGVGAASADRLMILAGQVKQDLLDHGMGLARALSRSPSAQKDTGVDAAELSADLDKRHELEKLSTAHNRTVAHLTSVKATLEAWQYQAQRRVLLVILTKLGSPTLSQGDKETLLSDVSPVLSAEIGLLQENRGKRAETRDRNEATEEAIADLAQFDRLIATMEDIQKRRPVEPERLRQMAHYYETLLDQGGERPTATAEERRNLRG